MNGTTAARDKAIPTPFRPWETACLYTACCIVGFAIVAFLVGVSNPSVYSMKFVLGAIGIYGSSISVAAGLIALTLRLLRLRSGAIAMLVTAGLSTILISLIVFPALLDGDFRRAYSSFVWGMVLVFPVMIGVAFAAVAAYVIEEHMIRRRAGRKSQGSLSPSPE